MIAYVKHSMGRDVTIPGFAAGYHDDQTFEVTGEDLLRFYQLGFDVLLTHRQRDGAAPNVHTVLLDDRGRRFCQR